MYESNLEIANIAMLYGSILRCVVLTSLQNVNPIWLNFSNFLLYGVLVWGGGLSKPVTGLINYCILHNIAYSHKIDSTHNSYRH